MENIQLLMYFLAGGAALFLLAVVFVYYQLIKPAPSGERVAGLLTITMNRLWSA
jgi:hypothetical protein